MNLTTVRVDISTREVWEVALTDPGDRVTCKTLEEASHLAHQCAADRVPSELIVCDAYHRVVHRQVINRREGPGRAPRATHQPAHSRPEASSRGPIGARPRRR